MKIYKNISGPWVGQAGQKILAQGFIIFLLLFCFVGAASAQTYEMSNPYSLGDFTPCKNGFYDSFYTNAYNDKDTYFTFTVSTPVTLRLGVCNDINPLSDYPVSVTVLDASFNQIDYSDQSSCGNYGLIERYFDIGKYIIVLTPDFYNQFVGLAIDPVVSSSQGVPMGANWSIPHDVVGNTYSNIANSAEICLGNDYGDVGADVFYRFTITQSSLVTIDNCGSAIGTNLYLTDGYHTELYSSLAIGNLTCQAQKIQQVLQPGTYYVIAEGYEMERGNITTNILIDAGDGCQKLSALPSIDQNYIATYTPNSPMDSRIEFLNASICDLQLDVVYYDGLGRQIQQIGVRAAPPGDMDIVVPMVYDSYGREARKYLPYASVNNNGSYKANAIADVLSYYNGSIPAVGQHNVFSSPFSDTKLEAIPSSRPLEQGAPGIPWQLGSGHNPTIGYSANALGEVPHWKVTVSGAENDGNYPEMTLYRTETTDENGNKSIEFKDNGGLVVLKKVQDGVGTYLSTHYVYDVLGNLRYVVPPAVTASVLTVDQSDTNFWNFIYAYRYDPRNRLIEKKIPGKGWEEVIYNPADQVVFTQDAVQRLAAHRSFVKYDRFGRVVMTGVDLGHTSSRAEMQNTVNGLTVLYESRDNSPTNFHGYNNLSCPSFVPNLQAHVVNYYDSYDIPGIPENLSLSYTARTKGLLTASKVKVLGTVDKWLWTLNYYDDDGRLVRVRTDNHLGGTDVVVNTYRFTGELESSVRTHVVASATTTISDVYSYDHRMRKVGTTRKINDGAEVLLGRHVYGPVGQLISKKLHNELQSTDFTYNERGWLKKAESPQFSYQLKYSDGAVPQYNGNIAEQHWGSGVGYSNVFSYGYDRMNRLTSALSTGVVMSEVLTYDAMGNITTLNRDGTGVGIYNYTGNRLNSIIGGGLAGGSYSYDDNGNATTDGRTGVSLTYNYLNLPVTATKTGLNLSYTYDANGNKLSRNSNGSVTQYVGGIQYKPDGTIDFIQNEVGISRRKTDGSYSYEYTLRDHLGNSRYSFDIYSGVPRRIQQQDYYAFGKVASGQYVSGDKNAYLYNGKELQEELGQLDYGARFYDPVIGRWNVVDPLAEKYYSYSPYAYVVNNPIALVDPNGMEIQEIAGGVRFTEEDAKSAFNVLAGRAKNVYMSIVGQSSVRGRINDYQKKNGNGQWAGFAAKDFNEANLAMGAFGEKSINNFVLETHGGNNDSESYMRIDENGSSSPGSYIYSNEVRDFNNGIQNPEVSQLSAMAGKIKDGGNFILAACYVGIGKSGTNFGQNLNQLTGNRLNIFLPQSFVHTGRISNPSGTTIQFDGSLNVDNGKGWLGVAPNGTMQNINKIMLSRTIYPPVRIIK